MDECEHVCMHHMRVDENQGYLYVRLGNVDHAVIGVLGWHII